MAPSSQLMDRERAGKGGTGGNLVMITAAAEPVPSSNSLRRGGVGEAALEASRAEGPLSSS